jgi:hypothetical protein
MTIIGHWLSPAIEPLPKDEYWRVVKSKFDQLVSEFRERWDESIDPEFLPDICIGEIQELWATSDYIIGYIGNEPFYDGGPLRFAYADLIAGKRDYNNSKHLELDAYLQFEKWLDGKQTYWDKSRTGKCQESNSETSNKVSGDSLSTLLEIFKMLEGTDDPKRRGYLLQDLLNKLFALYKIPVLKSFKRNDSAEQIDGAFKLEGWHYLVECRWRKKLADIRELDGVKGQVDRSGRQTMGFFLSINGWSDNVPLLLKQNPNKSIILMNGHDLNCVLIGRINLIDLIQAKVAKLNFEGEPFCGASEFLETQATR